MIQNVQNWGEAGLAAFTNALTQVVGFLPALIGAIIILVIGWFLGRVLGRLVARLLRSAGMERIAERIGASQFLNRAGVRRLDASGVLGQAVNWTIRLIFLQMAVETLGLQQLTVLLNQMIAFVPNIFVAAIILVVAGLLGGLLRGVVRGSVGSAGAGGAGVVGEFAYWAVVGFGVIAALNQLSIAPVVVNTLFIGLVATLVLALGLSFGLGGRETAAELTRGWASRARQLAPRGPERQPAGGSYRDPLTRPHPSEHEDRERGEQSEEHPGRVAEARAATPLDEMRRQAGEESQ